MILLTLALIATASATGSVPAGEAAITAGLNGLAWLLGQPLVWAFVVPAATGALKRLPQVNQNSTAVMRSIAALLAVGAAFASAWASGDFSGFGVEEALKTAGEAALVLAAATGIYHAQKNPKT